MSSTPSKVGYQGMPGCYSEGAIGELYGSQPQFKTKSFQSVPLSTFRALFDALIKGEVDSALVPAENTHSGTLHNVYDLLTAQPSISIVGEFIFHEEHCLVALPGVKLEDITEVRSHPHVLDQCSSYLGKLGDKVSLTQTEDTAGSASYIKEKQLKHVAAVAGKRAAKLYGLEALATGIEDDKSCATRYFLLSKEAVVPSPNSSPKTSFIISLKNAPGQLFKALSCFALRDINVCKLETRPSSRAGAMSTTIRPWEYVMYLDVDGSIGEGNLKNAISNLHEFATTIRVLGSYPRYLPAAPSSNYGAFGM